MLEASIKKIEGIVNNSKSKISVLFQSGRDKVDIGTRTAKDCGLVLDAFSQNVTQVNEISGACQEQAIGEQEVTKARDKYGQEPGQEKWLPKGRFWTPWFLAEQEGYSPLVRRREPIGLDNRRRRLGRKTKNIGGLAATDRGPASTSFLTQGKERKALLFWWFLTYTTGLIIPAVASTKRYHEFKWKDRG